MELKVPGSNPALYTFFFPSVFLFLFLFCFVCLFALLLLFFKYIPSRANVL